MAGSIGRHVELSGEVYYGDMALDCAPPGAAGPQELVMETKETCCALVLGYNPENSTPCSR